MNPEIRQDTLATRERLPPTGKPDRRQALLGIAVLASSAGVRGLGYVR
jgi:hypothetical protein